MAREDIERMKGNANRTPEEQSALARKAGIASGEARRRKRDMKEAAKMLLEMPLSSNQHTMKATLKSLGIKEEDSDYAMAVMASMLIQAANGNVKAATFLRDTSGNKPVETIEINKDVDETAIAISEYIDEYKKRDLGPDSE